MRTLRLSRSVRITWCLVRSDDSLDKHIYSCEIPRLETISCSFGEYCVLCASVSVLNSCRSSNKRVGRTPKWCYINGCVCMFAKRGIAFHRRWQSFFRFSQHWCDIQQHQQKQQKPNIARNGCRIESEREKKKIGENEITKATKSFHWRRILFQVWTSETAGKWKSFMCCGLLAVCHRSRVGLIVETPPSLTFLVRHVNCAKRNINRKV